MAEMFVGGYAQPGAAGIRRFALDPRTGEITLAAECNSLENPSWLLCHPRRQVLYAVEELSPEGRVAALSIADGRIEPICALPSGGADPCHLSLSPDARHLFAANYTSGSLAVFALDGAGVPVEMTDFAQHRMDAPGIHPQRQERAHAHFSLCDGARVFVCDLGMDAVLVYGWDAARGKLIDRGERIPLPGGAGPRHLALSADARYLYVLCELSSEVHVFAQDADGWRSAQRVRTVPEDFADGARSTGAAVRIADGRTLCASNRGHDSLALFPILADGRLGERQLLPSYGRTPRDVQMINDCLIAANQDSGNLSVFRQLDGTYVRINTATIGGQPSCVCVLT